MTQAESMQIDLKMKKSGTLNITEDLHLSKGDREMTVSSSSKNIQSQGYHEDNSSSQIVKQTNDKYSADTPCLREVLSPSNSIRTEIGEFRPSFSSVSNVTSKNKPNKSMSDLEYESLSSRSLWYKACLASEAKELLRKQCEVEQTVSPSGSTLVTSGTLTDDEANDTASDSSTVGGVVGFQPFEGEESILQSIHRSNLAQVEALQKEIDEMREQSSYYHELLEYLDTIQAENKRLESQIEDVSQILERDIKKTEKMKNLSQALTSHVEKQEFNQNRQMELHDEKVKQLKSIIIRDQRYFAKTEMEHQVTFRNLIIEKEKTKKLEAILDQQDDNESLISYDFDTPMERKEISRLEQNIASLNMEIAHIRRRDEYHIRINIFKKHQLYCNGK